MCVQSCSQDLKFRGESSKWGNYREWVCGRGLWAIPPWGQEQTCNQIIHLSVCFKRRLCKVYFLNSTSRQEGEYIQFNWPKKWWETMTNSDLDYHMPEKYKLYTYSVTMKWNCIGNGQKYNKLLIAVISVRQIIYGWLYFYVFQYLPPTKK